MLSASQRVTWVTSFPLDGDGNPTSDAAYNLLAWLLRHSHQSYRVDVLATILHLPQELLGIMCEQLRQLDLLLETPPYSQCYRYNVNCWHVEQQAQVERALLDYPDRATAMNLPLLPPLTGSRPAGLAQ